MIVVLLVGFATASLSRLIAAERGPKGLLQKLRELFPEESEMGQAIRCPICLGVYVSTLLTLLAIVILITNPVLLWILAIPASLGIAYALVGLSNLWS